ncbi:hypothetical protein B0H13DRAFT_1898392 [Mycena leptocephala]|nr:hypothetical protein B0H13DRAFT_1898392 [Mycena leptocephala]
MSACKVRITHYEQCLGGGKSGETPLTLLRLKDKSHNSFEVQESGFGIQYAPSPSYKKFNQEEIGRQVELQSKSVETPPTLLRLKDKFHNSVELLESRLGIHQVPSPSYKKFNSEEIGRQFELERKSVETPPTLLRLKDKFHKIPLRCRNHTVFKGESFQIKETKGRKLTLEGPQKLSLPP